MPAVQRLTRTGQFHTEVVEILSLSPRMRRIVLRDPELAEHPWPLGCDIAIVLSGPDGREVRRRYTVRRAVGDTLVVDAVLHGHGPGSTWAAGLGVGDRVIFFGPRGEIVPTRADWVLALTDESGLPAIAALAEAYVPEQARLTVLAEIATEDERYELPPGVPVRWLVRGEHPAGSADLMIAALDGVTPGAGRGYAYVLGESRAVVGVREALARFSLDRNDVYAKGYWNLQARPTR